ncbi:hypothetical protein GOP47_0015690 [Adiantum capillus-veneris]|uniref:Bacterial surface antigen (D15) domain-containing protein n=1 Tax=Adiantum capillus-veneris TaxID=13818 RepID=A0A9D4UKS8_ADICA|nr:hypothetical protein GOP47_0015690 [Adiantum capillus-veneris]
MEGEATGSSEEEEPKGEQSFHGVYTEHSEKDGDNLVAPSLEEPPQVAEEEEDEEDEEVEEEPQSWRASPERLFWKFAEQPMKLRVHDLRIEGNEVARANAHIESLGIFEECVISLEPGPVELPGTANVIVSVKEPSRVYSGDMGVYTKPETRNCIFEGSLKLKNLLGRAETWDGTGSYSWDGATEFSAGLYYPRFKDFPAAFVTRASIFGQDWMKYSSYTERIVGLSAGLVSKRHDLSYNLTWRTLEDPVRTASRSVRRQLGHSFLSSLKYTFKIDKRDSPLRPTKGYAFRSATQIAGIGPDSNLLRFVRQELDVRCAIPLGFYNAALNVGISGGLIMPWGEGFRQKTTSISDRFFIGGHTPLVCGLDGPVTVSGFRSRGLGPMDLRRRAPTVTEGSEPAETKDTLGGDLALTGFADLSFDLPLNFLREQDIHAHCFVSAGNLFGLPELDRQSMTWEKIYSSTRVSAGAGVVIPTRILRLEINFCRILRQFDSDCGKTGFQVSFASPF